MFLPSLWCARIWKLILAFIVLSGTSARAQEVGPVPNFFLGLGMGQDVGGIIGAKATYWVAPYLSGFVGGGWALADAGWNAGVEVRMRSQQRVQPFLTGMYGYNGVIHIEGLEKLDKIYYGPTIGGGIFLRQRRKHNYWRFSINIPFRPAEMFDDWEAIKLRPDVQVINDPLPITFGAGFHFAL